jgi:antitoxin ParD1/3/4
MTSPFELVRFLETKTARPPAGFGHCGRVHRRGPIRGPIAKIDKVRYHGYSGNEVSYQAIEVDSMNVSLTPELEQLIHKKVETGLYHSASEVVREALRLLEDRDKLQAMRLEEIRRAIREGLDEADRGEVEPLDVRGTLAKVRNLRRKASGEA